MIKVVTLHHHVYFFAVFRCVIMPLTGVINYVFVLLYEYMDDLDLLGL